MPTPSSSWLVKVRNQGFFLLKEDMPHLIACDRLHQVLIRCNGCRMTVAAQDVAHVLAMVERAGGDWVRDVSLLAGDQLIALANQGATKKQVSEARVEHINAQDFSRHEFNEADCGGVFDGFSVSSDADSGL